MHHGTVLYSPVMHCHRRYSQASIRGRLYEGRIALSTGYPFFSTFVKLAVDRYNLRLRFGIYKLKFLRSIVRSRSVVSQLFG